MATQIVMDATGDTRHEFAPADAAAVAEAENRFRELTGAGFTAAVRNAEGRSELIRGFDPRPYSFLDYRAAETCLSKRLCCQ